MKKLAVILCFFCASLNAQNYFKPTSTFNLIHPKKNPYVGQPIAPPAEAGDKISLDFVGTGDIQKSISEGKEIKANTGVGIIFEWYRGVNKVIQSLELESTINIASTADTIKAKIDSNQMVTNRREFGTYILNPVSARQALNFNANVYFGYPGKFKYFSMIFSGLNVRVVASNNIWQYKNNNIDLGAMYFRAGLFHEFLPDDYRIKNGKSKYSIFLGMNYTFRGIYGDLGSDNNAQLRNQILGMGQKYHSGVEFNFGFRLYNLRAEFQMPMINRKGYGLPGLNNTQFVFSIKFVGGFSLKLKSKEEDEKEEE